MSDSAKLRFQFYRIAVLGNKSTDVKLAVVLGLNSNAVLRDARAIEPLKRLVQNLNLQKKELGICREAASVIQKIEAM